MKLETCSTQTVNQNANVAMEVCSVVIKRISGMTVFVSGLNNSIKLCYEPFFYEGHKILSVDRLSVSVAYQVLFYLLNIKYSLKKNYLSMPGVREPCGLINSIGQQY